MPTYRAYRSSGGFFFLSFLIPLENCLVKLWWFGFFICINEPPHDKSKTNACAPSEDSDQPGHPPSLISLRCPHEETLGPEIPTERTANTLIQQNACAPSEDSDQPGHPPSLIRVFVIRTKKPWVLSYPLSAKRILWSDWVDAQADLSLRWAYTHLVGFVMSWLKSCWFQTVATRLSESLQ